MWAIKKEIHYQQLCEDFRSLNTFLWQMPIIMMTFTGGIWYAACNFNLTDAAKTGILLFGALANVLMIFALFRLRNVMAMLHKRIFELDGREDPGRNKRVVFIFSAILGLASLGSAIVSIKPDYFILDKTAEKAELTPKSTGVSLVACACNQSAK